ncbi:MAG: Fic family protein [Alphaproteobacteria bacterium]
MASGSNLTPEEIAEVEAANGLRQFDLGLEMIRYFLDPERPFSLRTSHIRELQKVAVQGLEADAGEWRSGKVRIEKSRHTPPEPHLVPSLCQEMCDYVNNNWHERTPFHLSAYVMWRINWIHPFSEGNGRTSRIVSYVLLCTALGYELPGSPSIPQQIQENRGGYFSALEAADAAYRRNSEVDVTSMEEAIKNMLARQLLSVIEAGSGIGGVQD